MSTPAQPNSSTNLPKKSRKKLLLGLAAGVLVLVGGVILLAPTLAGAFAPGIIAGQAGKFVKGKVAVADASFSWGGPQRIQGLTWTDDQGKEVVKTTVSTSAGLIGLITGSLDIGQLNVSDTSVKLVRHADGQLNVQKLLVPQPAGPAGGAAPAGESQSKPIQLPKGLKAKLTVNKVDLTLIDEAGVGGAASPTTVRLANVLATADIDPTQPLKATFAADASSGTSGEGKIELDLTATNWADSAGIVTIDAATLQAKLGITSLPMALVDGLVGPVVKDQSGKPVPLAAALGPTLNVTVNANGTIKDAAADLNVTLQRLTVNGTLRVADGTLTATQPVTVAIKGAALTDLVPALRAALATNQQANSNQTGIDAMPDVTARLADVRVKLPQGGAPLDLRGAAATIALETTQVTGSVVTNAGERPRVMRIAPLAATLRTADLAQGANLTLQTNATLDGQPAGDIAVNAAVAGLLDAQGAPVKGMPSSIDADLRVQRIATAVVQPFVRAMNLDLARDIGPTLDLELSAKTAAASNAPAGTQPPLDINLRADAAMLRARGGFTLRQDALAGRAVGGQGEPVFIIEADAGGRLAEAITSKGPWKVSAAPGGSGKTMVRVNWLNLPLTSDRKPDLRQADASVGIDLEQLVITKVDASSTASPATAPRAITLPKFGAGVSIAKGGKLAVGAQGQFAYAGQQGGIGANFTVPDAIIAAPAGSAQPWAIADPMTLRPEGGVEIVNLSTALAELFVAPPAVDPATGKPGLDIVALLREVVGPGVVIRANTKPAANQADALALEAVIDSGQFKLTTNATLAPTLVTIAGLALDTTLSPQSAASVLATLAPDMPEADRPRLAGPARATLAVEPLTIPLDKDRKPKLAEAGTLKAKFTLPGRVLVDNLKTSDTQRARAGVEDFTLDLEAPVSSLLATDQGGKPGEAGLTLRGNLLGAPQGTTERPLGELDGSARIALAAAKPQSLHADIALAKLSTAGLDSLLAKDGLLAGALGQTADIRIVANSNADASQADAAITLTAPNVTTTGPLKLRQEPTRLSLVEPARFTIKAQPSFVEALLKPKDAANTAAKAAPLALSQETLIDLAINTLVLPRAAKNADGTSAKAPPPDVALALTIPQAALRTSDNQILNIANTRVTINPATNIAGVTPGDKPLAFDIAVDSVQVPNQQHSGSEASGKVALTGNVRNLVDATGAFSMDGAILDARGDMPSVPTALLDVLAKKDGLLVEALGPIIEVKLLAERYPLMGKPVAGVAPGVLDLHAKSDRASASIKGNLEDAVLVSSEPMRADLLEITAGLAGRVVKGLPLLGTFEKKREDRPASLVATGLRVPLSNDLSKLSGQVTIDPGQLRFGAGSEFAQLLNLAKIKTNTSIGTRLDPLTITVTNGVATYPKWRVPLGEFTMETEGTVDLVNRQIDVVTYIPFGALADEAAGLFNTGAGGKLSELLGGASPIINAASMMPFRTKGSMDKPSTRPDLELFGKQFLNQLKPENLIERGLGELLKPREKK
jgi:hypothetical protein